eukprot:5791363-Karenia_brevis.AAC.1
MAEAETQTQVSAFNTDGLQHASSQTQLSFQEADLACVVLHGADASLALHAVAERSEAFLNIDFFKLTTCFM